VWGSTFFFRTSIGTFPYGERLGKTFA